MNTRAEATKYRVIKTGHMIARKKRDVRVIPVLAEDHPRKEIFKTNRLQVDDKFSELRWLCSAK